MTAATPQFRLPSMDQLAGIDASSTMAAVRGVIADPSSNTTLAVLMLVVVLLAVLVLALVVLVVATPSRKKVVKVRRYRGGRPGPASQREPRPPLAEQPRPTRTAVLVDALFSPVVVVVLILAAVIGGYVSTSTDRYCAQTCHQDTSQALTAQRIDHARCASCHEAGGVLSAPVNVVSRARMAIEYAMGGDPANGAAPQDSAECLGCHGEIRDGVSLSAQGLRMSHAEVIDAAIPCTWCHARSGHTSLSATPPMSKCLSCHDSKTASAECETCHEQAPNSKVVVSGKDGPLGEADYVYPAVRAANRDCGGCHDVAKECDPCHGIRMPHTRDFKEGDHARSAAFDAKRRCWKCHDPQWCSSTPGCHTAAFEPDTGDTSHGRGWKQEHKRARWGAGCVCHSSRSDRTYSICYRCHTKDRRLRPVSP